jgi:invasion protein IalB
MIARILFAASLFAVLVMPQSVIAKTVRVVTKENAVRVDCRFFAPVAAKVSYGDPLEVLSEEGDWVKVRFEETEGCIHNSAVTKKKIKTIKKKSGDEDEADRSDATEEEVALAGKGFNPAVEKRYREENPDLDFDAIDSIEAYTVPDDVLVEFIDEGGLKQPQ